ncbi:hypothetical protein SDJN02_10335, partial [Cucurbita argyrosperma subsp. argyrosperma]
MGYLGSCICGCVVFLGLSPPPPPPATKERAIEERCFPRIRGKSILCVVDLFGDRNSEGVTTLRNGAGTSPSPEKEDRYYATRGSAGAAVVDENGRISTNSNGNSNSKAEERGFVWPKLFIALSSKEKEEDFMAMKGCKLPQRPKKRAKMIQRSLLLVSPGAWLSEMSQERYEVREKKSTKKRPTGLKAMGSMESDSE